MPNYLSEVTGYSMYVILTELSSYLSLFFIFVFDLGASRATLFVNPPFLCFI